ncbi:MAG: AMIN domain-containing protein [Firmicutes bacterium]|nr:AMIN domain-containing protein [Bacillota bacterium]
MKKRIGSTIILILFLISISQLSFAEDKFKIGDKVRCNVEVLNIRREPSIMDDCIGKLKKDEIVTIKSKPLTNGRYKWYEISYENINGWVAGRYLTLEKRNIKNKYAFVDVDSKLMLRNKTSIKSKILARLKDETKVEILSEPILKESYNWIKVKAEGKIGYVSKDYLRYETQVSRGDKRDKNKVNEIVKIKDIQLKQDENILSAINILTSKTVNYDKYILEQVESNTERIVLDFKESEIKNNFDKKLNSYPVEKIWLGPLKGKENVIRMVITLNKNVEVSISRLENRNGLQINFKNKKNQTIIIDPGHGGDNTISYNGHIGDSGAISPYTKVMEKDLVLKVSLKLREILINRGYNVVMTRDKDVYIDLYKRAEIANEADASAFISLHFNSEKNNTSATGILSLYCPSFESEVKTEDQYPFAKVMQDTLVNKLNRKNKGIFKSPGYVVLRETKMPSVLLELGFLSNKEDEKLARTEDYQNKAVEAIADGLDKYFSEENNK